MGFLVLRALRSCIVVNQKVRTLAYTSRNFAALAFNISFQLVAVLVMMHISSYDESQSLAFISRFYRLLFLDNQLGQQMLHMQEMNIVLEPGDKLGTLFRSNTINACKLIIKHAQARRFYQFLHLVTAEQFFSHIAAAERNIQGVEQMTTVSMAALLYTLQKIAYTLLAKSFETGNLERIILQFVEICIFPDKTMIDEFPDSLF